MKTPPVPSAELSSNIHIVVDAKMSGSFTTLRDGKLLDVEYTFRVPKGNLQLGDRLIHRSSYEVFVVTELLSNGFILKDIKNDKQTEVDARTVKNSCWLVEETTRPETGR